MRLLFFTFTTLLHILCSTYKWYHIAFVFLFLPFLLSIIPSRSIHVIANGKISSSFYRYYSTVFTPHLFYPFIYCWTQVAFISWLFLLMLLWTLKYMGLFKLVFLFLFCFLFDVSPEVGFLGHMIVISLVFEEPPVFHSDCINLHFCQKCTRVPFSSHSHRICCLCSFWALAILTGERWYLVVILICIYLMIGDVEHPLICLFVICTFCLKMSRRTQWTFFQRGNIISLMDWTGMIPTDCERFWETKLWHRTRKLTTQGLSFSRTLKLYFCLTKLKQTTFSVFCCCCCCCLWEWIRMHFLYQ